MVVEMFVLIVTRILWTQDGCNRSTGESYSITAPDITSWDSRGPCLSQFSAYFYLCPGHPRDLYLGICDIIYIIIYNYFRK